MKKTLGFGLLIWALLPACNHVVNVEAETPPGIVPPAAPLPVAPEGNAGGKALPTARQVDSEGDIDVGSNRPETAAIDLFRSTYSERGNPRILVLLNRELSSEVLEWKRLQQIRLHSLNAGRDLSDQGGIQNDTGLADSGRSFPGERWRWAFETGFLEAFLAEGARLVDYRTILRLEDKDQSDAGLSDEFSQMEISAMRKYADIYVEILIGEDERSPFGYVFRSVAKEIASGKILASAAILDWDNLGAFRRSVFVDQEGYRIERDEFPSVNLVAEQLAYQTMAKLGRTWTLSGN